MEQPSRKEWARNTGINFRAIELLVGLADVISDIDNPAERDDFIMFANRIIEKIGLSCFYERDKKHVYLISKEQGLRYGKYDFAYHLG